MALCADLEGRDKGKGGVSRRRDICIIMADLSCCMAETNTTL